MTIDTMDELFVHKLQQMYYVENELVDALDEMAMNASNDKISTGFADHRDETREQVDRLEDVFGALGVPPEQREHPVLEGLETQRRDLEGQLTDDEMLDLIYLGAGMMTERVEMTGYDGLLMLAKKLEYDADVTDPLDMNRDEEQTAYRELDAMATASDLKSLWDRLTPS